MVYVCLCVCETEGEKERVRERKVLRVSQKNADRRRRNIILNKGSKRQEKKAKPMNRCHMKKDSL